MGVSVLLSSTGEAPEDMGANPNQKPARKNRFAVKRGVIPPSSQVLLFHPDQWEKLVEAACLNRPLGNGAKYAFVKQLGGAGDGGRDVEARLVPKSLTLDELMASDSCGEHFQSQRTLFYCAEGLKLFSRDTHGEAEFDALLDMVLTGVGPKVKSPRHKTGLDRLEAGTSGAEQLVVNDSVLAPKLRPGDLPGTCHHLANQKRLKWVK